jgi:hypothetical protein
MNLAHSETPLIIQPKSNRKKKKSKDSKIKFKNDLWLLPILIARTPLSFTENLNAQAQPMAFQEARASLPPDLTKNRLQKFRMPILVPDSVNTSKRRCPTIRV